jgi:hypothetical protein
VGPISYRSLDNKIEAKIFKSGFNQDGTYEITIVSLGEDKSEATQRVLENADRARFALSEYPLGKRK